MVRYRVEQLELRAASDPPLSPHQQKLEDAERRLIYRTLREHGGNVQAAADALGIPLESLQYRVDCLNVRLDDAESGNLKSLVAPPGPRPRRAQ